MKEIYNKFKNELLNNCVPFWLKYANDKEFGGIINCISRTGNIYSYDKSVWMQGRAGWMYSYIYNNIEKNEEYLNFAKSCIDFAKNHCIDNDGRMFFTVTREGKPLRKRRYFFSETFYIMSNIEYYKATNDITYLDEAKKYYSFVYGIYKDPSTDPYKITPKTIASTRDTKSLACPMILLNVTSIMRDIDKSNFKYYDDIVSSLIDDIKDFFEPEYNALFEYVDAKTNKPIFDSAPCRVINPGHDIECSWFLLEEGIKRKDHSITTLAETIFNNAFSFGWDDEYGGILYFKDVLGYPVEAYEHDMKLWWPHNEATIASLMLYLYTKNEKYKKIFDMVVSYEFSHFSDPGYGEWFGYLRRDGVPTYPPCKGHTYKGPFHVMRMLAKCMKLIEE